MDPIGLGFEHYDSVGRWRATENGKEVDAHGHVESADAAGNFDGVLDLAGKLAESKQVERCFVKNWFRYAFGRAEMSADECSLDRLVRRFEETNGNIRALVVELTQTDAFLYRKVDP
jgi:hypothetical protein